MRSACLFTSMWLISCVNVGSAAVEGNLSARIDRIAEKVFHQEGPGGVVVVVDDGRVIHNGRYGLADVKHNTAFTDETIFDLASTSKAFTAMSVLILCQRGKLKLDDDARTILTELKKKHYPEPITIRHLLNMTAGLPAYEDLFDSLATVDNEQVAKKIGSIDALSAPGEKYAYSNTAYSLLALLVKRMAGEPFPDFVKREIFQRLGMTHSLVMDRPGLKVPGRAAGYKRKKGRWVYTRNDTSVMGDGQVLTCVADMLLWEKALRESTLCDRQLLKMAWTSGKLNSGKRTGYGFGWSIERDEGDKEVWHSGSWDGTATYIGLFLKAKVSLLILSNCEDASPSDMATKLEPIILKSLGR